MVAVMMVAGSVDLSELMAVLQDTRAVFHSEADFQHAFAWAVHKLDGSVNVRLEVPQEDGERLDVLCFGIHGWTAVELKYFTAPWSGVSPVGEAFNLRDHAASDLARHGFINDIARLETFCRRRGRPATGLAIMLTNSRSLWSEPARHSTRDAQFRIHAGRMLTGTLRWGTDPNFHVPNERTLTGIYQMDWHSYSKLAGTNGEFRWLAAYVDPCAQRAPIQPS